MMQKIYAYYKGDKYITSGTQEEICEYTKKTPAEVRCLRAKRQRERYWAGYEREKKAGRKNNVSYIFRIDDEDDGYILAAIKGLECHTFFRYEDAIKWMHKSLKKSASYNVYTCTIQKAIKDGSIVGGYSWRLIENKPVVKNVYMRQKNVYEVLSRKDTYVIAKNISVLASFDNMAVAQTVLDMYADDNELMYAYSIKPEDECYGS